MLEELIRRKLRITYDDIDNDTRITDIIIQAKNTLKDELGIDNPGFNFEEPGPEQVLLVNFCFYEYNDAIDDYYNNYAGMIAQTREKWISRQYVKKTESDNSQ